MLDTDINLHTFIKEIELAKQVQKNLLPKKPPNVPGLDIWVATRFAYQIGGDFYDFIWDSGQTLNFVMADICGKGVSGALLMPMTRMVIRNVASREFGLSPEEIISQSNKYLYDDFNNTDTFATAFIGNFNPRTSIFVYANAGLSPVIYYPFGGVAQYLQADGTPIGIFEISESINHYIHLKPGDILLIGTDGIVDNYRRQGDLYEAYLQLLKETERLVNKSAQKIVESLFTKSNMDKRSNVLNDDQTLMVIKCT